MEMADFDILPGLSEVGLLVIQFCVMVFILILHFFAIFPLAKALKLPASLTIPSFVILLAVFFGIVYGIRGKNRDRLEFFEDIINFSIAFAVVDILLILLTIIERKKLPNYVFMLIFFSLWPLNFLAIILAQKLDILK